MTCVKVLIYFPSSLELVGYMKIIKWLYEMAKVRLRFGENEIEIESKDFYVDNQSANEIITNLSTLVKEGKAGVVEYTYSHEDTEKPKTNYLHTLEDAEIHEPEFTRPISVDISQIKSKLHILARDYFFEQPRTVSEVVAQLREYGWAARPLDVSKILAGMAFNKECQKYMRENRSYYAVHKIAQIS